MAEPAFNPPESLPEELTPINLKNPGLAALLAWLWPGAGHLYQGRTAKGILFMVCILGTYFYGFAIGQGHVVYASWRPDDRRLPYLCQIGVGLPALPALVQSMGDRPLLGNFMRQPEVFRDWAPGHEADELSKWHAQAGVFFELGTLYTMVAGLLNILAIYDAFAGPVFTKEKDESEPPDDSDDNSDGVDVKRPQPWSSKVDASIMGTGAMLGLLLAIPINRSFQEPSFFVQIAVSSVCAGIVAGLFSMAGWIVKSAVSAVRKGSNANDDGAKRDS